MIGMVMVPGVWGGFDTISHDHPLFAGDIGVYGSRGGNYAIR